MKTARIVLNYLLFGNIYIAFGAVLLSMHSSLYFSKIIHPVILTFIFFSTISSYNLHSYFHPLGSSLSERFDWIGRNKGVLLISLIITSVISLLALSAISSLWEWILPLAVLTLLYSMPRIFPSTNKLLNPIQYLKAFYLAFVWTFVTVILPLNVDIPGISSEWGIFLLNRYVFILQVCLLFDYRDWYLMKPELRKSALKRLDERNFNVLFYIVFSATLLSAMLLLLLNYNLKNFLSIFIAELFMFMVFRKSRNSKSDYWYSIAVDGILMIPAILLLLFKI